MSVVLNGGVNTSAPPLEWSLGPSGQPFFFDAWLRLHHNSSLTITQHPVETGAAITDHSFVNPRRFSFDVGETDVASNPVVSGPSTRSINAFKVISEMQATRQPLTLVSKYGVFENILIESIDVPDNFQTKYALRATINLVQIITANTRTVAVSSNPQATDLTNRGQVSGLNLQGRWFNIVSDFVSGLFGG